MTITGVKREARTLLDEVVAMAKALGPVDYVIGYKARPPKPPAPARTAPSKPVAAKPVESKTFVCRHCGGVNLHAQHGRFGYYFACIDCAKNTPMQSNCPTCGTKTKIRKDRLQFLGECEACKSSRVIHVNERLDELEA